MEGRQARLSQFPMERHRIAGRKMGRGYSEEESESYEISANTLQMLEESLKNMIAGNVSDPIDLT